MSTPRPELVDAHEIAVMLGLRHSNSVSTYFKRYADFPRPVLSGGRGRMRVWLRADIEGWQRGRVNRRQTT